MVTAVVPAAGRSRRMGRAKPLLPFEPGGTVLGALVASLRAADVDRLVLVRRREDGALARWCRANQVPDAVNPEPERGMLSSLWSGIQALGGADALAAAGRPLLICPADHPRIAPQTVRRLVESVEAGALLTVPVLRGRRGHPLAIAASLVPEVLHLDPAVGLRQLLVRHAGALLELEVADPGILCDLDTPEEYRKALQSRAAGADD